MFTANERVLASVLSLCLVLRRPGTWPVGWLVTTAGPWPLAVQSSALCSELRLFPLTLSTCPFSGCFTIFNAQTTQRSCQWGKRLNPFSASACKRSGLKSAHIHACKEYIWWSYNKSHFQYCVYSQKPFTCSCVGGRNAFMVSVLALLLVVLRMTAGQTWQCTVNCLITLKSPVHCVTRPFTVGKDGGNEAS